VTNGITSASHTLTGTLIAATVNAATIGNIGANMVGTGTYLTSLNASNLSSGTVPSAQISGSYTGITAVGTIATGTWNGSVIGATYGGTGVNNGSNTLTLSGSYTLNQSVASGASPTLSGANFSSIPNGALTNSSVTVTAGSGLGGGGAVALGSSVTLTNAGVTSAVAGTAISVSGATGAVTINNTGVTSAVAGTGVSVSGATGAVTVSIGQAIGTGNSPTFAGITVPSITHSGTSGSGDIGASGAAFGTVWATATSAKYADLAERYVADAVYEPGTVVVFGGNEEITVTEQFADVRVAGAISTDPAYLMNSASTGLPVALRGKVPTKLFGPVTRGDLLVTCDSRPGFAVSVGQNTQFGHAVFAKSLTTDLTEGEKVITAVII
jgi:hypothetical protein